MVQSLLLLLIMQFIGKKMQQLKAEWEDVQFLLSLNFLSNWNGLQKRIPSTRMYTF